MSITLSVRDGLQTSLGVTTRFHPVYSIRERSIIGLEALSRGYAGISAEEIPPGELFSQAKQEDRVSELDAHCRKTALAAFSSLTTDAAASPLLFLNISPDAVTGRISEPGFLMDMMLESGITPDQVVLEISESGIDDIDALSFFVNFHRQKGFLIALDNESPGESNLARISLLKPDIIKMDRSLINGIARGYHKQELSKALIQLSHRVGALTVAVGVEDSEEALACLELGVDMLQGFYFCRPMSPEEYGNLSADRIFSLAKAYADQARERKEHEQLLAATHRDLAERLTERLGGKSPEEFPAILKSSLRSTRFARCAYIVDTLGRQISPTIIQKGFSKKDHRLFNPAPPGTDHSLKTYFLRRGTLESCYITEPYISKATGDLCITASRGFYADQNEEFILCIDIDHRSRDEF